MKAKTIVEAAASERRKTLLAEVKFEAGPDADDCPHCWTHKPQYPPGMWDDRPVDRVSSSLFVTRHHFSGPPYEMALKVFEVYGWTDPEFHRYPDDGSTYCAEISNNRGLVVHRTLCSESPHIAILNALTGIPPDQFEKVRRELYADAEIVAAGRRFQKRRALAGLA